MTVLTHRFENALIYACHIHASDVRKGTEIPYVSHLLAVASLILENGGTEDEAIGALLHDAAEDHGGERRLEDIRVRFGDTVAAIVHGCTDTFEDPKPPWRPRKQAYIERLQHEPLHVLKVSLADKVHNARAILRDYRAVGEPLWERFNGRREGTLWYYRALVDAFQGADAFRDGDVPLIAELDRVVSELEFLASAAARDRVR